MKAKRYPYRPMVPPPGSSVDANSFQYNVPVSEPELRAIYPDAVIVGFVVRNEGKLFVVADDGA